MGWDIPQETTPHTEGEMAFKISVVIKDFILNFPLTVSLAVLEQINRKVDPKTALKLSP